MRLVVVVAALAVGGTIAGAIQATHVQDVVTLGRALSDAIQQPQTQPAPEPAHDRHLRAVPGKP
jgi:hypothetical protein